MVLVAEGIALGVRTTPLVTRTKSIRENVAWVGVGNAVYLGCQYGMLMAIAKLGNPTYVGQFALAQAITAPLIIFSQMQLRQLQVTDVKGEAAFADYFGVRLVATTIALTVILVIAVAGYERESALVIAVIGIAKAFESLSDIAHGRLQRQERMELIAFSLMLKGVGSLVVLSLLLWLTRDLVWAVVGLAAVWGTLFVLYDLRAQSKVAPAGEPIWLWRPQVAKSLVRTALPLAATSGLISISGNIPRYFLDGMYGKEAVAIFSVAAAPLVLVGLLGTALNQATLPRAATYFQTGQFAAFRRLAVWLTVVLVLAGAAFVAVFVLFGEQLISILFTPEYRSAVPLMVIMAAGVAVSGLAAWGSTILSAGRKFNLQLLNVVVMVALQVPVCYVLIRWYGVVGAGWAELVRYAASTLFFLAAGAVVYRRHEPYVRFQGNDGNEGQRI
jgi:O-antigen/teichoic acid export membrane protein